MVEGVYIEAMAAALAERQFPAITVWNRLEGRPRTPEFDRALRAEVRDALWMLTRQWQLGEFRGDDAGSPVVARLHLATTQLTRYRPGEHDPQPMPTDAPLEAVVERRPVPLSRGGREIALDLRLVMGRQWLRMTAGIGDHAADFVERYPVDPPAAGDADRLAHPEAWQSYAAAAGRLMDGGKLLDHLADAPGNRAYDGITGVSAADQTRFDDQAELFVAWFERLILQPPADDAWAPERLEYRYACSAPEPPGERVFVADEYAQGRLDWYAVDVDPGATGLEGPADAGGDVTGSVTHTLMPVPIELDGMPNTRWWAFEEGRTNFGAVDASTTDLAKLLFVEFGLVYSNDWFVIPCTLPTGTNARVRGLSVQNVFGERFWIEGMGAGDEDDLRRWAMFRQSARGGSEEPFDAGLLLLPTVPKVQEGDPVEEVVLVRDEMANMVWGVERVVTLPSGHTRPGSEAAAETRGWFEREAGPPDGTVPEPAADLRYRIMTSVPENWIPFVPARVEGSTREIQLQRAGMPRIIEGHGGRPDRVEPRTALLRQGLDEEERRPYFVHEEEVPREGARVAQSFQRTRWRDGRVVVWLGAHKRVAQGESSSGLAFDQLVDARPPQA